MMVAAASTTRSIHLAQLDNGELSDEYATCLAAPETGWFEVRSAFRAVFKVGVIDSPFDASGSTAHRLRVQARLVSSLGLCRTQWDQFPQVGVAQIRLHEHPDPDY